MNKTLEKIQNKFYQIRIKIKNKIKKILMNAKRFSLMFNP